MSIIGEMGSMNQRALADKYGVSLPTIRRLIKENKATSMASAEKVDLPTESETATASAAPTPKFKSKKVTIKPESVMLPDEPVAAPAAPAASKRSRNKKVKVVNDEIEEIQVDEQLELDNFERMLNGAEDEEEEAIRLEQEEAEAEPEVTDLGLGKFKQSRPNQRNPSAPMELTEEEALEALLGGNAAEQFVNEVVSKPSKRGSRGTAAAPVMESEEMLALRAKTMSKIHLNVSTFGDHLPWIKNKDKFLADLYRKTTRELTDMCTLIETQRSLGNAANQLKHLFILASQGVEVVTTTYLDLKTQGFAEELAQKDKELTMIFQEIAIDSADTLRAYTTPHARLGMLFASTLFAVDNRNRMTEYRHNLENKAPAPGIKQEYSDI